MNRNLQSTISRTCAALFVICSLGAGVTRAEVPGQIKFQGRLLDPGGTPVTTNLPMSVAVWTADTGGTMVFTQSLGSVEVRDGLYDFAWGGAGLVDVLTNSQSWLEVSVNGEVLTPRHQILSVPYALRAREATSLSSDLSEQVRTDVRAGIEELIYPAFEAIQAGDAVGLSYFVPGSATAYDNSANGDGYQFLLPYTNGMGTVVAQQFTIPTLVDGKDVLRPAQVQIRARGTSPAPNLVASIRETLTGPVITSGSPYTGNGVAWVDAGPMSALVPGQTYFITLHNTTTTTPEAVYSTTNTNPPPGSAAFASADGGTTWASLPDRNYIIRITYAVSDALGHYEVFQSSAAAFDERFSFYGYAKEDALPGEPVTIVQSRITDLHEGLEPGRKYYLSDTPGEISPTPGTRRLELGRAMTTNSLVRENKVSTYISVGSGTYVARMPGLIATGSDHGARDVWFDDRADFDGGEFTWGRSIRLRTEGGVAGLHLKNGDRVRSSWGVYFAPILP